MRRIVLITLATVARARRGRDHAVVPGGTTGFDFSNGEVEHGAATLMTDAGVGSGGGTAAITCSMSHEDEDAFTSSGAGGRILAIQASVD